MITFDFGEISEEAERRFHKHLRSGVRGQTVTERDGPEFWYALVAFEKTSERPNEYSTKIKRALMEELDNMPYKKI